MVPRKRQRIYKCNQEIVLYVRVDIVVLLNVAVTSTKAFYICIYIWIEAKQTLDVVQWLKGNQMMHHYRSMYVCIFYSYVNSLIFFVPTF